MGLDTVELIMEFENHFNIRFKDEDIQQISRVEEISNLICQMIDITSENKEEFNSLYALFQDYFGNHIQLADKISNYLQINNFQDLSNFLNLKIKNYSNILKYIFLDYHFIKWEELTVEEFINAILITNCKHLFDNNTPKTQYQVYLIVGSIILDRIGCPVYDIQPYASITRNLRID
ncbi:MULTISPECIES: hypothetical protein [Empedobacter]|uniref:Carrier domain-containing protein n=1 Tax=Empedobacter falsenii TaxID=343874 RepID=A0A3R8ST43_9FLAO|nr:MULTISPECIES: hypothetical protein [Empedobacter]MBW1617929.1 hypothetical protein [Empedobacter falsenii]MDH0659068.1 hypothetical protein [Empedobacter sp. GD03865]MDH1601182.1 hypothetical protein [Empedobacter sp. GD03739]RRT93431.1 hypothetical protein EGI89_03240 [Empedobacter falsenii]RRT93577.1 hypothetical protein EGI88_03250 [Empedobacter falsenii]